MTMSFFRWTAGIVALIVAGTVAAHHSISMFEISTPVWVKGTVVSVEAINPHAIIVLEGSTSDGPRILPVIRPRHFTDTCC